MPYETEKTKSSAAAAAAGHAMMEIEAGKPSGNGVVAGGLSHLSETLWREKTSLEIVGDVSARLTWKDLTVMVTLNNGETQKVLEGLTGYAEPGTFTALMGPSGSGKSTLLDALSSRLAANAFLSGTILLNGRKRKLSFGTAAYVTQDDNLIGTLTVRETISYSARLRLPDKMAWSEKRALVESTIIEMGLQDCADTVIGNWHLRGISGGEKRRSSYELIGRFFQFFAQAGFPCPALRNPSDHFLRCINSDFDKVKAKLKGSMELRFEASDDPLEKITTAEAIRVLIDSYRSSQYSYAAREKVEEISKVKGTVLDSGGSQASFFMQAFQLSKRSFINMSRDFGYYWLRLVIYIVVTVCIGTIYLNVGTGYSSILARGSCASFVFGFVTFMSIGGFPSFVEDMKVFQRERLNGHYGVTAFVISNTLSAMPFLILITFLAGTVCYFMVRLHPGFEHYLFFVLCLYASVTVVESLMMAIASIVPNFLMGIIIGAGIQGIFMLVSGYFRLPNDIPKPVWRYPMSYISFHFWALQVKNTTFVRFLGRRAKGATSTTLILSLNLIITTCSIGSESLSVPTSFLRYNEQTPFDGFRYRAVDAFVFDIDLPLSFQDIMLSSNNFARGELGKFDVDDFLADVGQYQNDLSGLLFDNQTPDLPKIPGEYILENVFQINTARSKWIDLSVILSMIVVYRIIFFIMIKFSEDVTPWIRGYMARRRIQQKNGNQNTTVAPDGLTQSPSLRNHARR
ncbi:hypothetical protein DVH24_015143 [Malus domestica]|uniref:ABC transporter domain-containing protein n=1 Tax=Malus domestica TaxID=3750 RepID=A0A498K691_MALDO|nr:hypothetical protein DVH24_015143 [Malus domestica]